MRFNVTDDLKIINQVLKDDFIFSKSSDDNSNKDFEYIRGTFINVIVEDNGKFLGMFFLDPRNSVHYEIHTCLFQGLTSRQSLDIINEGYKWLFSIFPVLKLSTYVPVFNKRAIRFAEYAGMKREGILVKSFLKDGILWDQIIMGINKEEVCQQ